MGSREGVAEANDEVSKENMEHNCGLTWTLVGSVIVLITLSGETQKIAFYLTVGGLFVHYVYKLTQSED